MNVHPNVQNKSNTNQHWKRGIPGILHFIKERFKTAIHLRPNGFLIALRLELLLLQQLLLDFLKLTFKFHQLVFASVGVAIIVEVASGRGFFRALL